MNAPGDAMRTTGMLLTHAWCLNPEFRQEFAEKYPQVTLVDDPREMIAHIDGVYVDDITAIPLYPLLAKPFLEAASRPLSTGPLPPRWPRAARWWKQQKNTARHFCRHRPGNLPRA
ncbi:MAG: hypothetical protein ACJ0UT_02985 [Candidatus Latescibacterota bacterium]